MCFERPVHEFSQATNNNRKTEKLKWKALDERKFEKKMF